LVTSEASRPGRPDAALPPRRPRRWAAAAAWTCAGGAFYALQLQAVTGVRLDSDGANSALQAWDMFHGNPLLHGWIFGDATYYTLELPLIGIAQLIFGLGVRSAHLASATTFFLVVAFAVSLAVAGGRGLAQAARAGVTVAVLTVPLLTMAMLITLMAEPDHAGTSAFLLASALVIECRPGWKLAAPLLCLILAAGQLGDATVLYIVLPAIVVICGYRQLAAFLPQRKASGRFRAVLRSPDAAILAGAIASVPLEMAIRALMRLLGGYEMVAPRVKLAPPSLWPRQLAITWMNIRTLFATVPESHTPLGAVVPALGWLCLAAAVAGAGRVAWTWRRASRAEQVLAVAIVFNIAIYAVSTMVNIVNYRELAAVLPCSAVLAARALVPGQVRAPVRAIAAVAVAVAVALVPLSAAATRPYAGAATGPAPLDGDGDVPLAPVIAWCEEHGISYALSDYFISSATTVGSAGQVSVRATGQGHGIPAWEDDTRWYDPARYDIRYVVTQDYHEVWYLAALGRPAAVYRISRGWMVLKYTMNLLPKLTPPNHPAS